VPCSPCKIAPRHLRNERYNNSYKRFYWTDLVMIRRIKPIFLTAGIFLLGLVLTGCGGGGDTPPENVTAPNVGLASLALEGYDIDFDSSRTGTYSVTVAADVSEV